MTNISKTFIFLFFILAIGACNKEEPTSDPESNYLLGNWINPQYSDSLITLESSPNLVDTVYGISFKSNGKLVERKNIGWCGTPPISYGNYEGNWSEKDSVVNIEVGFWGGTVALQWEIVSIDNKHLTVQQMSVEYIEE
jgi:hypothetical protein